MSLDSEAQLLEEQCPSTGKPSCQCFSGSGRAEEVKPPSRWSIKPCQETKLVFQYRWCDVLSDHTLTYLPESTRFSSTDRYRCAHIYTCVRIHV